MLTLQLEGEVISQMTTLVVSSEQPKRIRVPDLQRPEVQNALRPSTICHMVPRQMSHLYTKVAAINVVAQEKIACLCGVATDFEQLHEVVVLAVDITAHSNGCVHLEQVGLRL